ncbi:hypothetical protein [Xenorhabdus cabanillasii]|uniref:Uncharacterized protein n=1 Tax=Xenorhabdus cabanillasii JM26 TaxID=1427517 RepID=W1IQ90_9GAMM|nr:hypothetical protein [Xenorhabdus cabanillasii]PHM75913.1 exported hypothetical protein [Xenorhabdus cabanillasii JM26]CDL79983.1 conserved hypothetical protein [Xenorhabdus cabanillasii JM26]
MRTLIAMFIYCTVSALVITLMIFIFLKKDSSVNEKMSDVDTRLQHLEVSQQKFINESEFTQFKLQWESKFSALEQRVNKQGETLSYLDEKIGKINNQSQNGEVRFQALESLLSLLENSQKQYEKQLETLKSQLSGIAETKKSVQPVYKKTTDKPRQLSQSKAPFVFSGIEYRGGKAFAVVVPNNIISLSQIQLIDIGEEVQGWTLAHMSSDSAKFTSKGRSLTLHAK